MIDFAPLLVNPSSITLLAIVYTIVELKITC